MAFKPRSKATFGIPPKRPTSEVVMDSRSFIRQAPSSLIRDIKPYSQAQLWMDVTELDTSNIEKTDEDYNSNMWKNFKFVRSKASAGSLQHSRSNSNSKRKVTLPKYTITKVDQDPHVREMVSDIYPLKLPKPSNIGEYTYDKFLNEAKLQEQKRQRIGLQLGKNLEFQNRVLKIRSECRAPPVNFEGEIIPPKDFRKYPQRLDSFTFDESYLETQPLSYVAQTSRPYTGTPDFRFGGSPWRQLGLRGSSKIDHSSWADLYRADRGVVFKD